MSSNQRVGIRRWELSSGGQHRAAGVFASLLATLAVLVGCTMFPFDGARVEDQEDPIEFEGYHWKPNVDVEVQAFNWSTGSYDTVAMATTESAEAFRFSDGPVYKWSVSESLDADHWEDAWRGQHARIRAVGAAGTYGTELISVDEDWLSCLAENNTRRGFYDNCYSQNSPDARVLSSDYCAGPPLWDPYKVNYGIYGGHFRTTSNGRRLGILNVHVYVSHPGPIDEGTSALLVSDAVVPALGDRARLQCTEFRRRETEERDVVGEGFTSLWLQCSVQIGDFSNNGEQHFPDECSFLSWTNEPAGF